MSASAASFNAQLTNYAAGISQDTASRLARFICPIVVTGGAFGQYKKFDDKNAFQAYETARAIGGARKRIEFAATDPYYNCKPNGLEVPVDDQERLLAGPTAARLVEAKIKTLVTTCNVSNEKKIFDMVKAAKAATGSIGVWSSSSNDPIAEIDGEIEAISTETGIMPNKMVIGLGAWRVLKNHAKTLARQPGMASQGVTLDQLAGMLLNPAIKIEVGILSRDTVKFGAAKNAVNIVGGEVFIFYGGDQPDQYDPSFAKCFATSGDMVESVRQYREDKTASDIYYVDWSEDPQVVSAACGRRITLS